MTAYLIWFLIGLAFIVLEMAVPGFILFFFSIGSWFVSILVFFFEFSLQWQIGLFIVISLLCLIVLRRFALKTFQGQSGKAEDCGFAPVEKGQLVEVVQDISPEKPGRIKFRGSFWQAVSSFSLHKGESAILQEKKDEGSMVYIVTPVKNEEKND